MTAAAYLHEAVVAPLGMTDTGLRGPPAKDVWSTADDPHCRRRVAGADAGGAGDAGGGDERAVPGPGRDRARLRQLRATAGAWGVRDQGRQVAPLDRTGVARLGTFGHFGGAGTFLWVDPDAGVACAVLTNREFGDWALPLWSAWSAEVLAEASERGGQ